MARIDGTLYRVQGIETFRPLYGAPFEEDKDQPPSGVAGLLVAEVEG